MKMTYLDLSSVMLFEDDIPGSVISDVKTKTTELQFWLHCRVLKYKSADTRTGLQAS